MKADNPLVNTLCPVYNLLYPSKNSFFWTDAGCTQLVKVRDNRRLRVRCLCLFPSCQVSLKPELTAPSLSLRSAVVHSPDRNPFFSDETVPFVDEVQTVNYFSVPWEQDEFTFKEIYTRRLTTTAARELVGSPTMTPASAL